MSHTTSKPGVLGTAGLYHTSQPVFAAISALWSHRFLPLLLPHRPATGSCGSKPPFQGTSLTGHADAKVTPALLSGPNPAHTGLKTKPNLVLSSAAPHLRVARLSQERGVTQRAAAACCWETRSSPNRQTTGHHHAEETQAMP